MCNTYYFFSATMVTRMRLNVTFIRTLLVFAITRSFDVVYSSFVTLSLTIQSKRKTKKAKEI